MAPAVEISPRATRESFSCTLETLDEIFRFADRNGLQDATFYEVTRAWKSSKLH